MGYINGTPCIFTLDLKACFIVVHFSCRKWRAKGALSTVN